MVADAVVATILQAGEAPGAEWMGGQVQAETSEGTEWHSATAAGWHSVPWQGSLSSWYPRSLCPLPNTTPSSPPPLHTVTPTLAPA